MNIFNPPGDASPEKGSLPNKKTAKMAVLKRKWSGR